MTSLVSKVPTRYVVVRTDLPFPQQAVQACHAILESQKSFPDPPNSVHPYVIVCRAKSMATLNNIAHKLQQSGIPLVYFHEPDRGGELTAIATCTVFDRTPFRKLQLLQGV